MAQSKQALRSRIRSVKSTRKITKAMEMIANAKLFKQRNRMEQNREYAQRLQSTVASIAADSPDLDEMYLKPKTSTMAMTIVFTSDLGLCGAYNANVLKFALANLNPADPIVLIGTSMYHQFQENGFHILNEKPISSDKLTLMELKGWVEQGTHLYEQNEAGTVQVLYTAFEPLTTSVISWVIAAWRALLYSSSSSSLRLSALSLAVFMATLREPCSAVVASIHSA